MSEFKNPPIRPPLPRSAPVSPEAAEILRAIFNEADRTIAPALGKAMHAGSALAVFAALRTAVDRRDPALAEQLIPTLCETARPGRRFLIHDTEVRL